jgi:hypothetical protein
MSDKTVLDIVSEYLKANGFDGLTDDDECGCTLGDLAPCGECICNCFPAYDHGPRYDCDNWMSRKKLGTGEGEG